MEEISYLEQEMVDVPGLYNVSVDQLKDNVVSMLNELSSGIQGGDYEKVLSILANPDKMGILLHRTKSINQ